MFFRPVLGKSVTALFLIALIPISAFTQIQDYAQSCNEGNLGSCNDLALYYLAQENYQYGIELLTQACNGGEAVSCSNLAEQYFDGILVERDWPRAYALFASACNANIPSGCAGLCLLVDRSRQLPAQDRGTCESMLAASCDGGNEWMCQKQLSSVTQPQTNSVQCEGQDLEATVQLIERIWSIGMSIGYSNDPFTALNQFWVEIQNASNAAARLPHPCQVLLQQWSAALGGAGSGGATGSGGTQCMGGVCCDGTGCY